MLRARDMRVMRNDEGELAFALLANKQWWYVLRVGHQIERVHVDGFDDWGLAHGFRRVELPFVRRTRIHVG